MPNIRKGKGYTWKDSVTALAGQDRSATGFTVDNLDTKKLTEANNKYEKIFIIVRDILQSNPENSTLQSAQDIADTIRAKGLL